MADIPKEEFERAREDVRSILSHRFRTPLSSVRWLLESLEADTLSDKQRKYLQSVRQLDEELIAFTDDLLNMVRFQLGAEKPKIESTGLFALLDAIVQSLQPAADRRKLKVNLAADPDVTITVNVNILKAVLHDMLANAIDYSLEGGAVSLAATAEGDRIVFSVSDTGLGIPEAEKDHIFEKLYRASNAKAYKPWGTGLSLYVDRALTKRMGGELTFESTEGKGSVFYLRIPKQL